MVTLPKGKTEQKAQSQPCCADYSSPTPCEKFPTFNKTIPAEFYCLQLLIKHALRESKCLKSFASTKQLSHYPSAIPVTAIPEGHTTELSLHSSSGTHTHTPATGDPSQENPANFPKNLLSVDNLSQLNILSVFALPPGAAEAVWVWEEICATFHNQGRPKPGHSSPGAILCLPT